MVAFNSFARLPMLRWSVCSLMAPSSSAVPSDRRPPDGGRTAAASLPRRELASGGQRGPCSAGGRAGLPQVADGLGVGLTAVAARGHPHVVPQAAGGSGNGSDRVVHGTHCGRNDPAHVPMPRPTVASATAGPSPGGTVTGGHGVGVLDPRQGRRGGLTG